MRKTYEFIYKFRPDGDKWRETVKSYTATTPEDYNRVDKILTENPTEYILINIIPHEVTEW